ncbi:MAG: metallophosphoesterase [Candidatus Stygibacter australis]|nr:metallophosphoesterase [Candidatus Stygibacter australis]MDP8321468.1 metallophosphoesterase [Candidatus Stygibacter australis]
MIVVLMLFSVVMLMTALSVRKINLKGKNKTRFAVMTDMHYFPASLINQHSLSFHDYLKQDAKLTLESGAVIKSAIKQMIRSDIEFVILAGDVSNEGEKLSHEGLAEFLKIFKVNNIKVYITPGNHDINNPVAYNFLRDIPERIDTVTPEEFESIYYECGFKQAFSRDEKTLSYCAEIKPGLKIITLDANQYRFHKRNSIPDGVLPEETLQWAEGLIKEAVENGERMIGVMHHGLVEHFLNQGKTFGAFLVKDYQKMGKRLARAGLDFVFTGHLHAQDVSSAGFDDCTIYDIETAALTSVPFAWRLLNLKPDELDIETVYIDDIDFDYGSDLPFRTWASEKVWKGLLELESFFLRSHNGLTEEQTKVVAPYYARAFMAHFKGNEKPDAEDIEFYEKHRSDPKSPFQKVARIFSALWTDSPESDLDLSIPLRPLKKQD